MSRLATLVHPPAVLQLKLVLFISQLTLTGISVLSVIIQYSPEGLSRGISLQELAGLLRVPIVGDGTVTTSFWLSVYV